jgi:hypothetical protein
MIVHPHPSLLRNAAPLDFPNHAKPLKLRTKTASQHSYDSDNKTVDSFSTEDGSHSQVEHRGRGSVSRPIAISSTEAKRRAQEIEDGERAEIWYRNVTWHMHARIVEYREKHPLPEAYFVMHESNNERALEQMEYDENGANDRAPFPRDEEDESPFMIFDLDIEDEETVPEMVEDEYFSFPRS